MTDPLLIDIPSEIVSKRIIVRPYRAGDGAALHEAITASREHLKPTMPWAHREDTPEQTEALVRRFDANWRLREDMTCGIWRREDGRYLGGSGLHRIDWHVRRFEIGYWIRADEEGKGYVTEAASLLCDLCFGLLEAARVFIRCDAKNHRSAAVPRRLGFEQEALLRNEGRNTDGELYDMLIFGMTPERWGARG